MAHKTYVSRLLAMLVLLLACAGPASAQTDSAGFKTYRVDKSKVKKDTTKAAVSASIVPIEGDCVITGSASVSAGSLTTYFLSCGDASLAEYWQVSCGTAEYFYGDEIGIQWNVPGCSSATIWAYGANGTVLARKTVTILPGPLNGGNIPNPSQTIAYNKQPAPIIANPAGGGNCSVYSYQWESSPDHYNVPYSTIPGATGQNYQPGPLTQTMYYKRKVTCGSAYAYTYNAAIVYITPPLYPGCITSANQTVYITSTPAPIIASVATNGSCSGAYQYQWLRSTDNIYFKEISGATSKDLSFSGALSQTTYFQRRVTCGNEVKYIGTAIVYVTTTLFSNAARSGTFTRTNCGSNSYGASVTYTVPAGRYTSTISVDDANTKADQDIAQNGQAYANQYGACMPLFYNTAKSGPFTKSCTSDYVGNTVTYTVPANSYSSTISQADADQKALDDIALNGQNYANQNGTCTPYIVLNSATTNGNQLTVNYSLNYTSSTCFVNWLDEGTGENSGSTGNAGGCQSPRTVSLPKYNYTYRVWVTSSINGTYRHSTPIYVRTGGQVFTSASLSYTFRRNNCGGNSVGGTYFYSVPQGWRTSTISQADADAKATTDFNLQGQSLANQSAGCTWYNYQISQSFQKQCPTDQTGSSVTYTVSVNKYSSTITQADADAKAQTDMTQNGQAYANQNGACTANAVYARLLYENVNNYYDGTYADVVVRFYSDAACTQPVSAGGFALFYGSNSTCDGSWSDVASTGGTDVYLAFQVPLYFLGYRCSPWSGYCGYQECYTDYWLEPGSGYVIN